MVHGILHLIGYKDESEEQAQMRAKEDYYLSLRQKHHGRKLRCFRIMIL